MPSTVLFKDQGAREHQLSGSSNEIDPSLHFPGFRGCNFASGPVFNTENTDFFPFCTILCSSVETSLFDFPILLVSIKSELNQTKVWTRTSGLAEPCWARKCLPDHMMSNHISLPPWPLIFHSSLTVTRICWWQCLQLWWRLCLVFVLYSLTSRNSHPSQIQHLYQISKLPYLQHQWMPPSLIKNLVNTKDQGVVTVVI